MTTTFKNCSFIVADGFTSVADDENQTLWQNSSQTFTSIRSSAQLTFDAVFLCLQIITLPVFIRYKTFRSSICYRIMFVIGVCDFVLLLDDILSIILISMLDVSGVLCKVLGSVSTVFSMLYALQLILALNRLVIVVKTFASPGSSKIVRPWERYSFNALYIFFGLLLIALMCVYFSPFVCAEYYKEYFYWKYTWLPQYTWVQALKNIEVYVFFTAPLLILGVYMGIVVAIRIGKARYNVEQTEIERRILIQSFILFLALIAASFFDTIWILFGVTTSEDVKNNALYANNILDSLLYGINPVMNITLNREFRSGFCKMWFYRPAGRVQVMKTNARQLNLHIV